MKPKNWLEEDSYDIYSNTGFEGLILSFIPGYRAKELLNLLWVIKWAGADAEMWGELLKNAVSEISERHVTIECVAEQYKALHFADLYNKHKYFWMRKIS